MSMKRYPYSEEPDEILLERARELAAPFEERSSRRLTLICFTAGHVHYAIESTSVVTVIDSAHSDHRHNAAYRSTHNQSSALFLRLGIVAVPLAPAFIVGIVHHHGQVSAVIDLSKLINNIPTDISSTSQLLLIRQSDIELCLLTEKRAETLTIKEEEMKKNVDVLPHYLHHVLKGVVPSYELFLGLLDPARIVHHEKLDALTQPTIPIQR